MANKLRHSIAFRLLLAVFLFSFVIALIASGVRLYFDYRSEIGSIENHFKEIQESQLNSIAASLWVMDTEQLQIRLNGILNVAYMRHATIRYKDRLIVSAGTPEARLGRHRIYHEFPLYYTHNDKQVYIGTLAIGASLSEVYENLESRLSAIFLYQGLYVFIISLFIFFIFQFYVTKHLTAIASYFRELDKSKSYKPLILQGRSAPVTVTDEIDEVVTAINTMLRRRLKAEKELAEEKERLAVTLRSIGDGVITADTEGRIALINKVAEDLTGWNQAEAIGKPLDQVFRIINAQSRERCDNLVGNVMLSGGIFTLAGRTALIARDGTERIIADSVAPIRDRESAIIGVVLVFRDITEKEKMEKEILKAQNLKSLGILAGGIAHDFNNLLTAILGNVSLIKMSAQPEDKIYERLTEVEKASARARDLTQQLLTFSEGGTPIKKVTSIAAFIRDSIGFILSGSNVCCTFDIADDLWPVEVDEGQINQVINNLIINAEQAMPDGGTINVSCRNVIIDEKVPVPLTKGKYLQLSVKDHGAGIAEEHLQKIFDPYFTTKEAGRGLGLATIYSIIKNHSGHIAVESKMGVGTIFTIYLPASESKTMAPEVDTAAMRGKGRILVMDDEQIIRDVVGSILTALGYQAAFACDGTEAIEIYKKAKESANPFDAVIVDLTIPGGMGGKETIKRLLEIDPWVKAIVSSGYSTDPVSADFKKYGFSHAVIKPYKAQELSKALHDVINNNGGREL